MTVSPGGSPPSATPSATPAAVAEISGLASRQAAWQVLLAVAAGAWADAALERELNRRPLSAADRALVTELAYGAIRQRRLLDAWLDAHGRVRAEQQPPKLRWLLHVGLYQLLFSARVPASAAVSTTVELAKRGGLGRLAPVVNGLLRAVLRRREREGAGAGPAGVVALEPWQGLELPLDPAALRGAGRGSRRPGRAAGPPRRAPGPGGSERRRPGCSARWRSGHAPARGSAASSCRARHPRH